MILGHNELFSHPVAISNWRLSDLPRLGLVSSYLPVDRLFNGSPWCCFAFSEKTESEEDTLTCPVCVRVPPPPAAIKTKREPLKEIFASQHQRASGCQRYAAKSSPIAGGGPS